MSLTDAEKYWFNSLVQQRLHPLDKKFESGKNRFDHTVSSYQRMIESNVANKIDVQVDTYIETFSHFNKRPTEDDLRYLVELLSAHADSGSNSFREYLARLGAPSFPQDSIDQVCQSLVEELNVMIAVGLRRFNRLLIDDKALRKIGKKVDIVFWLAITGLVLTLVGSVVSIFTPEIRKGLSLSP